MNIKRLKSVAVSLVALAASLISVTSNANTSLQVQFLDAGSAYASYYAGIESAIDAAGYRWISAFGDPGNSTLTVGVSFTHISTANSRSDTIAQVASNGSTGIYEQGAAFKMLTGVDRNGAAPDIDFQIGIDGYLQNELWFDPALNTSIKSVVPASQTDAYSIFLHEFGHAFGFNGWLDVNGMIPNQTESTFDALVTTTNTQGGITSFFTGTTAERINGGPVALTYANYGHVGNLSPRPGSDLLSDLMGGVYFNRGQRYDISALDLAIMSDIGLPTAVSAVPEPSTYVLLIVGLAFIFRCRNRVTSRVS